MIDLESRHLARLQKPSLGVHGPYIGLGGSRRGFSSAAQTYFAAMAVQEPFAVKQAVNTFINGLISDGTWTLIDRMILPMGTEQASLLDVKQPTKTCTNVNACTFTAYRGFNGNAVSSYVDFGEALNFAGNNLSLNSAFLLAYCNLAGSVNARLIGGANDTNTRVTGGVGTAQTICSVNDASVTLVLGPSIAQAASRLAVRSGAANKSLFVNGAGPTTVAEVSTAVTTGNACVLRTGANSTDARIACGAYGGALSDAQAISFQSRLHTLMTSLGANY